MRSYVALTQVAFLIAFGTACWLHIPPLMAATSGLVMLATVAYSYTQKGS